MPQAESTPTPVPPPRAPLSPSEALFGFCAWLSTQDGTLKIGATHDAAPLPGLVAAFCMHNNLAPPEPDWYTRLNAPPKITPKIVIAK